MKKVLISLVLGGMLAVLLIPAIASAQPRECCDLSSNIKYGATTYDEDDCVGPNEAALDDCTCTGDEQETSDWGTVCLLNSVNKIFNWIFVVIVALVGIMVIIGAFTIITAGGSAENVGKGRNYILFAMIGMVVALLAKVIPAIVRTLV